MMKILCATALALALFVAAPALAEDAMTNAELTQLLSGGKTIGLGGPGEGYNGELTLNPDGTGKGTAKTDDGKVLTLTGTWRIDGDHFCPTWQEFNDGKEVCETWIKDGPSKVKVMKDGEQIGVNYW
jgi:hypothetical protein